MPLATCQRCGATIALSVSGSGAWLDEDNSLVCSGSNRLHSPTL